MIKGLHIDLCRHFIEYDTIMNTIMLMNKLGFNTLHLHLTDDQSIAFESLKYPEIKFKNFLTLEQQHNIKKMCKTLGIDIIPEIDIPGHSAAFRHIFDGTELENNLGLVTKTYIDIEKHMPIIFNLMEELMERFDSDYIHIGCDEAKNFEFFPELLSLVEEWLLGKTEKNYKFIVWDDVVSKITNIPKNMIVQRWRHHTSGKIKSLNIPYILSEGYYLDKCMDPIYLTKQNPNVYGGNLLGWIACTWTELIDNNNFYNSIVPSIYLLPHIWSDNKYAKENVAQILYQSCEKYGYPISNYLEWRRRKWVSFLGDQSDIRNINSIDIGMELNREHDKYPVFSKYLIELLYTLDNLLENKILKNSYIIELHTHFIFKENFNDYNSCSKKNSISWLFKMTNYKNLIDQINILVDYLMVKTKDQNYHNGFIPILLYIKRKLLVKIS